MSQQYPTNHRGQQALNISIAFTAIAGFIVLLRTYTRFLIVRSAGTEDYGIILAMICSIGLTISIGFQAKWGMGLHSGSLNADDRILSLQTFWASLIVYSLSLGLTKISILLQYRRVFTTRKFQIICWIALAAVSVFTIWTVFGNMFLCYPISAFWTLAPGAKCLNQFALWFSNAAINIVTDFAIILLPIPVIRNLNLGRRQKTALTGIFAIGGFICVVSILRLQSLVKISNSNDPTYDNPPAATWSSVEVNVGLICSCLPVLRPLITCLRPSAFSSQKRSMHTAPRTYATIGSTSRARADYQSQNDIALGVTTPSRVPPTESGDIKVITDIRVHVEGEESELDRWKSPASEREWRENNNHKGTDKASSTETLVKQPGGTV